MSEYRIADEPKPKPSASRASRLNASPGLAPARSSSTKGPDRTAKLFIGGKQARPDSGYSYAVLNSGGREVGLAGLGNRKDIRNAVEAAAKALSWGAATAHNRAQVLYYVAENLAARADEFTRRLTAMTGASPAPPKIRSRRLHPPRVCLCRLCRQIRRRGALTTRSRFVTLAMNEPWGVMGIVLPERGRRCSPSSRLSCRRSRWAIVSSPVPSASHPLSATDYYSVLDTSDVPAGVVNIVTGEANVLAKTLAEHDDVDALWYAGDAEGAAQVEALSAGNLKSTWTSATSIDWTKAEGRAFLRRATQVKNIWTPYGE